MIKCLFFSATWFLVPENAKITEGFPVERGLEALLNQRYNETLSWIEKRETEPFENHDETIVEKIVSLIPEENSDCYDSGNQQQFTTETAKQKTTQQPTIQLHDPQAPDISRYFLVFRQGCNDYARLCVEKKGNNGKKGVKDSKGSSPTLQMNSVSSGASGTSIPDIPAVLPLDSVNPMLATSTVLSTSVSVADLSGEAHKQEMSGRSTASPIPSSNPPQSTANGYHSFRIYRTYASFYHTIASGSEGGGRSGSPRVQTQRQTSSTETSEIISKDSNKNKKNTNSGTSKSLAGSTASTNNPVLDATVAWKAIKTQNHSFKGHPLPSPEIPYDLDTPAPAKYVIFVVHGVGQRAFLKMGLHFNRDCDEMRNVLTDAAQARGLPPGSIVVLPVSWRAELNLAGNFTFGDDEEDSEEEESVSADNNNNNNTVSSPKIDKDLKELSETFNTKIDAASSTFRRAASVFEGQFTEILEKLALESIPAVRSVLSDATMDILLYVSQKHFKKILGAVLKEVLRLHRLFSHWNPEFSGEFSFCAHSLGSALVADLLSFTVQPDEFLANMKNSEEADYLSVFLNTAEGNVFPFKIDKFFAFGSPLGVFHLLKHKKPIGCVRSPHILTALEERSRKWQMARRRPGGEAVSDVPAWSVYNCRLFYNCFHPHDPVAHRFESLTVKPTGNSGLPPPLKIPYHKSGLTRFKMDLEAKIARAKDDWSKLTFKLPTWLGGSSSNDNEKNDVEVKIEETTEKSRSNSDLISRDENPLAAFNHHFRRVDFSLQDAVMENAYISALGAHFVYWSDLDIAAFIVSELIKN